MQNNRRTGTKYEELAADFLRKKGYHIIEKNFRCRLGEIDLIAERDGCIVFVEVKYRKDESCGFPEEAVDRRKQVRVSNAASYYLYSHFYPTGTPCRFDVVAADAGGEIRLIENAFYYCGNFC